MRFLFVACPIIFDLVCTEMYAAGFGSHNYPLTFELNGRLQKKCNKKTVSFAHAYYFDLFCHTTGVESDGVEEILS